MASPRRALRENEAQMQLSHSAEALRRSEAYLALAQELSHTGSFGWDVCSGQIYWSLETFRIFEFEPTAEPSIELITERIHPEDIANVQERFEQAARDRMEFTLEHRLLMPNGSVKHLLVTGRPSENESGCFEFVGAVIDITERKRAEAALQQGEQRLRDVIDTIPIMAWTANAEGANDFANQSWMQYTGLTSHGTSGARWRELFHPADLAAHADKWRHSVATGEPFENEARLKQVASGHFRWFLHRAVALRDNQGNIVKWYGTSTDIEDRKRAEQSLQRSEGYLAEAQRLTRTGSWVWQVEGRTALYLSDEWYRVYELDPADGLPNWARRLERVHPEDRNKWQGTIERAISEKSDYDVEFRILLPSGAIKWVHTVGHPILDPTGKLVQFLGTSMDITERKRAESDLRRSETYLAEAQRLSHTGSWAWNVRTRDVYWSDEMLRLVGLSAGKTEPTLADFLDRVHPDDRASVQERAEKESTQTDGQESEGDFRVISEDGKTRRLHSIAHSVLNASGEVVEVVGTTMDVTEQYEARAALETAFAEIKALKDQLFRENIALRDEIDKASMFEEIVGDSPALQAVLSRVAKVAPTDSTVLITGETGTGKELIARAIHKRSPRSSRAFVSVNCAAIPSTLISSELFGHERGAFTGALHRRLGRFELAEGGTIFLDEVSELPPETQVALLRVLQEREFERLGGTQSIRADLRVIAATNRDLETAIAAGAFRSDLFYRLSVFPIDIPALRERKEYIPTLVEYFIHRYSRKAGKKLRSIEKGTLDLLQMYAWPGNIRELQNIIERSVILCDTDTFSVDPSWLSMESATLARSPLPTGTKSPAHEKETIEAALAASAGRVSGPAGAAAQLNMPASTLESKIRSLKINKFRFKNA